MKLFFVFFFVCSFQNAVSQQGENYLKLMSKLILIDSTEIKECFKNGKPKLFGRVKYYKHGDLYYEMKVGKNIRYHKNGARTISIYDDWGTLLINRYYDSDDNLISQSITTLVDTSASNLDEFFKNSKHITFKTYFEDFAFDKKSRKIYLKETGQSDNGKKEGVWKSYYVSGEIKKEKSY